MLALLVWKGMKAMGRAARKTWTRARPSIGAPTAQAPSAPAEQAIKET
jgi:hypothetical protein